MVAKKGPRRAPKATPRMIESAQAISRPRGADAGGKGSRSASQPKGFTGGTYSNRIAASGKKRAGGGGSHRDSKGRFK